MINPISTYRIQFNKDFTFKDLREVLPYLHELGIKTIYASPIYKAVPDSPHGYDVTDPNQINPEIGTLEELRDISKMLKSYDMYWLQDIVPNHMGFHHDNAWLMDVLKNGEESVYRQYFDLISDDLAKEPIMVPFLGDDLEVVIANHQLELMENEDGYHLNYFDSIWPINNRHQNPRDIDIKALADSQYYRLCNYRETNTVINYRRFFTVNSLICLNMQLREVFDSYHQLTKQLLDEGIFQGLRVDHVDGLADPTAYLQQLRSLCGNDVYIVVEKILAHNEQLPRSWPIQGSTGYDYLGLTNQLFTHGYARKDFERSYETFAGKQDDVETQIRQKKKAFLQHYMQGELENLCRLTTKMLAREGKPQDATIVRELIASMLVELPIYRLYTNGNNLELGQIEILDEVLSKLLKENKFEPVLPSFRKLLLNSQAKDEKGISYFNRLMQFTGPLMAKGVEDTLMYTYHRFIGNNEVGDSPAHFGIDVEQFHAAVSTRAERWPLAMNATATHDTKRSEDGRSRLSGLTELAGEWMENIAKWRALNQKSKTREMPDENDEYFIYQTLIASCPEHGPDADHYPERLSAYIQKALRESKRRSNWDRPDSDYEEATKNFIAQLLNPKGSFWKCFEPFLQKAIRIGKLNSLGALILKHTLPGIPDTYQGTEFWDLSMVDPDNRRAVDYVARYKSLVEIRDRELSNLQLDLPVGTKLQLTYRLLQFRKAHRELFAEGTYQPLTISSTGNMQILAYARRYRQQWLVVIVPFCNRDLNLEKSSGNIPLGEIELTLPRALEQAEMEIKNVLTDKATSFDSILGSNHSISLDKILDGLPFAVYHFTVPEKKRSAGILMHLSSLPTAYGIGDLGPSADRFLDFLSHNGMKYWQFLPMNPVTAEQSFSPYSSISAMAGNILLISPEVLASLGLLDRGELSSSELRDDRKVDYQKAIEIKGKLLKKAYQNWLSTYSPIPKGDFDAFCEVQKDWLEDYVLFVLISQLENGKPWYQWPKALRQRNIEALNILREKHQDDLRELKWQQFIFFRQWAAFKQRAYQLGIELIGDLPFYCAHHSADVWANPEIFAIDGNGLITGTAGVPPDYFNADGQLWGMPVYDWKAMAQQHYDWWKKRMAMNLSLYDKVRLDHFRAFDEYWEVPAGSSTAKTGSWKVGPKKALFEALENFLGKMPLIAEDLGEITPNVYRLRDELGLPGMKVLQFAFGDDLPRSVHIPHQYKNSNCVVYTGTHDNNTTRGWFEEDIDEATKARIGSYLGAKVNGKSISQHLIRVALGSVAKIAIIPVQDLLNKPASDRMNTPASVNGNWTWKLRKKDFYQLMEKDIWELLQIYNR